MIHRFGDSDTAREVLGDRTTCPFMPVFGAPQVMITGGRGCRLTGSDGKEYLDFLAGIAVVSLGHGHPALAARIAEQAASVMHVSNVFANPWATRAAIAVDRLLSAAVGEAPGAGQVFFSNSGAEANELAIKIARKWGGPERHTVVSALGSFHGRTLATLAATGQPAKQAPFLPMPAGFDHVPYGDADALESRLSDRSMPAAAAVLLESFQGEAGVVVPDEGYLARARALCDEHNALLIVDEVQTGLGRTGRWFGFEHSRIAPDVVTLAKALGNGFPVGATWARREVAGILSPGDHGSTYSASALAGAVVECVIAELERLGAPERAESLGLLARRHFGAVGGVAAVRGSGLLLAVEIAPEITSTRTAGQIAAGLLERGLIVNAVTPTALRLAPPLIVTEADVVRAAELLAEELAS